MWDVFFQEFQLMHRHILQHHHFSAHLHNTLLSSICYIQVWHVWLCQCVREKSNIKMSSISKIIMKCPSTSCSERRRSVNHHKHKLLYKTVLLLSYKPFFFFLLYIVQRAPLFAYWQCSVILNWSVHQPQVGYPLGWDETWRHQKHRRLNTSTNWPAVGGCLQ